MLSLVINRLCTSINRINRLDDKYQLKLVVPAPAHAESFVEEFIESTGQTCSATVDWLIAGYAYAENCLLVTLEKNLKALRKKPLLMNLMLL